MISFSRVRAYLTFLVSHILEWFFAVTINHFLSCAMCFYNFYIVIGDYILDPETRYRRLLVYLCIQSKEAKCVCQGRVDHAKRTMRERAEESTSLTVDARETRDNFARDVAFRPFGSKRTRVALNPVLETLRLCPRSHERYTTEYCKIIKRNLRTEVSAERKRNRLSKMIFMRIDRK